MVSRGLPILKDHPMWDSQPNGALATSLRCKSWFWRPRRKKFSLPVRRRKTGHSYPSGHCNLQEQHNVWLLWSGFSEKRGSLPKSLLTDRLNLFPSKIRPSGPILNLILTSKWKGSFGTPACMLSHLRGTSKRWKSFYLLLLQSIKGKRLGGLYHKQCRTERWERLNVQR